jgi:hypothetical protein
MPRLAAPHSNSRGSNGPVAAAAGAASARGAGDGRSSTRQARPSSAALERTAPRQVASGRAAVGKSSFLSLGRPTPARARAGRPQPCSALSASRAHPRSALWVSCALVGHTPRSALYCIAHCAADRAWRCQRQARRAPVRRPASLSPPAQPNQWLRQPKTDRSAALRALRTAARPGSPESPRPRAHRRISGWLWGTPSGCARPWCRAAGPPRARRRAPRCRRPPPPPPAAGRRRSLPRRGRPGRPQQQGRWNRGVVGTALSRSAWNLPLAWPACAAVCAAQGAAPRRGPGPGPVWHAACLARGRARGAGQSERGAGARAGGARGWRGAASAPSKVSPRGSATSGVSTRLPGASSGTSTASTASPTSTWSRRPQRSAPHRAQQAGSRTPQSPDSSRPSRGT